MNQAIKTRQNGAGAGDGDGAGAGDGAGDGGAAAAAAGDKKPAQMAGSSGGGSDVNL